MTQTLQQAIKTNRERWARYRKTVDVLRKVRLNIFDYEDAGIATFAQATRIVARCELRLLVLRKANRKENVTR